MDSSSDKGVALPIVEERAMAPCTRRHALRGIAVAALAPLVTTGCAVRSRELTDAGSMPPGDGGGGLSDAGPADAGSAPPDAGMMSPDAGSGGSCDSSVNLCIDLSDPMNQSILGSVGSSGYAMLGSDTVIIMHTGSSMFTAVSAICTHAGCTVQYQASAHDLYCRCHGSTFNEDGSVVRGPAFYPLHQYRTQLMGTMLTVFAG